MPQEERGATTRTTTSSQYRARPGADGLCCRRLHLPAIRGVQGASSPRNKKGPSIAAEASSPAKVIRLGPSILSSCPG